jgi:microcompartment protein CcmL/EutN
MRDALGLVEITGWSPAMVVLDTMDKAGDVRLLQAELNDFYGVCIKIAGSAADVRAAVEAARACAEQLHVTCTAAVINRPEDVARPAWDARPEFSPLIEQDVVFIPNAGTQKESTPVSEQAPFAIGFIETQGLTAVIEAIDTACKAANVEVLGKEKLGGGYVTVIIKGDVAAVKAAVAAGQEKVNGLGKLIAAHVIARPSTAVLSLLPKA